MRDRRGQLSIEFMMIVSIEMILIGSILANVMSQYHGGQGSLFNAQLVNNANRLKLVVGNLFSVGAIGDTKTVAMYHTVPDIIENLWLNAGSVSFDGGATYQQAIYYSFKPVGGDETYDSSLAFILPSPHVAETATGQPIPIPAGTVYVTISKQQGQQKGVVKLVVSVEVVE